MPVMTLERAEAIVVGWRSDDLALDGGDNPAGPLFPGSDYAESEITMTGSPGTRCSSCTASSRVFCC
jgi:hypothetical protein